MINIVLVEPEIPMNTGNVAAPARPLAARSISSSPWALTSRTRRSSGRASIIGIWWTYTSMRPWMIFLPGIPSRTLAHHHQVCAPVQRRGVPGRLLALFSGRETGLPPALLQRYPERCVRTPHAGGGPQPEPGQHRGGGNL